MRVDIYIYNIYYIDMYNIHSFIHTILCFFRILYMTLASGFRWRFIGLLHVLSQMNQTVCLFFKKNMCPREENSNVWARVILVVFGVTVSFWSPKINGILTKSIGAFFVVVKDWFHGFPFVCCRERLLVKTCNAVSYKKRNGMKWIRNNTAVYTCFYVVVLRQFLNTLRLQHVRR